MADHSKIYFLSQTRDNFPLFVHQPPKIKFIFAYFLYPIKEKLFFFCIILRCSQVSEIRAFSLLQ